MPKFSLALLAVGLFFTAARAEDWESKTVGKNNVGPAGERSRLPSEEVMVGRGLTTAEVNLSIGVLVFGAFALSLTTIVMSRARRYWDSWSFKVFGLAVVLTAGLFLITAGYSQQQIGPMFGLLGTALGYLLGKEGSISDPTQEKSDQNKPG